MGKKKEKKSDDLPEENHKSSRSMIIAICVMIALILLATIDSFTTKYFQRLCTALANWTMNNAPYSFLVYELVIMIFLVCCLPYGPLGVLSGALFVQKYGKHGIYIAGFALFTTTLIGACICFILARNNFKNAVQAQIDRSPKLSFLKNLDRLIQNGQGIEMVILIRLAPLPKGPTNYFLGTTSLTWRDFIIGSAIVNLPMSFLDVCIGAGAKSVKKDNPVSIALFVTALVLFVGLICFVGSRAKKKLMALDAEDTNEEADEELAGLKDDLDDDEEEEEAPRRNNRKVSESLLDQLDPLQVIGKPNAWIYPDPRLNLVRQSNMSGRVDAITVQLSSATFSFQVISARLGWPLRIYPRDAKPRYGMHASEDGVLKEGEREAVVCAASDGSVRKGPGHGHNFHIVAETGDLVTIFVARSMQPEFDEYTPVSAVSMLDAQLEQIAYQVWYEITEKARPALKDGTSTTEDEEALVARNTSIRKSHLTVEDKNFERFDDAKFVGGDGIDISKSKRFSTKK